MATAQPAVAQSVNMSALRAYLLDHLAGGESAIRTLEDFRRHEGRCAVSQLAERLVSDIQADRDVLRRLLREAGGSNNPLRRLFSWLGAKLGGLKFWRRFSGELGPFEGAEILSLGILGKRALWVALRQLQAEAGLFPDEDFGALISKAEEQYQIVEDKRIEMIRQAFL
ncbi:hypothetical protein Mal64_18330 [Pseudobythopirellula maris]|uniref:DUF2383 domain-containing protein n=1 Tax=Pseudobythopirellula maris TaxID=2527991 RepID=A0A5C5ZPT9_9BACT|nr:hypothetical protein [Pseudobythopirellula maris]TWT88353.1 hypothetical protein Mal64_18330 [Pseudobythopirellula maris]